MSHFAPIGPKLAWALRRFARQSLAFSAFVLAALGSLPLPLRATPASPMFYLGGAIIGSSSSTSTPAKVSLAGLQVTYSGLPQAVTVTVIPAGLSTTVTYSSATYPASTLPPTNAGTYSVVATVTATSYAGNAIGTLVINKAPAKLVLSNLTATYNGSGQSATVTTTPLGLQVTVTYDAESALPVNVGSHAIKAAINDLNYMGSTLDTLNIVPAQAVVTLTPSSLSAVYNHTPVLVSATTAPTGLPLVITYRINGTTTTPINVGTYSVTATVLSPNGTGSTTGTLVINPATATVALGSLNAVFTGQPKPVTATTVPAGLPVGFSYNGIGSKAPSAVGAYTVVGTVANSNYVGSSTATLVISKPISFATAPAAPLLEASGAWISLGVNPGGVMTTAYFIFSTDPTFAVYHQTPNQVVGNGSSQTVLSAFLGQLQPNTTYYYEMVTLSAAGTYTSSVQSFTTLGFDTTLVATTGTTAPGTTSNFATLGNAAVEAHDGAAFSATLTGAGGNPANNTGIWVNQGSAALTLIAQTGSPAPGTGGTPWATLGDPIYNDKEDVAFGGTLLVPGIAATANRNGVWASNSGTLGLIARQGSTAPGTGGATFAAFNAVGLCNNGGAIVSATLADSLSQGVSLANNAGVWEGPTGTNLILMLRTGEQTNLGKTIASFTFLPLETCVNGQTRSFGPVTGHLVANTVQTDQSTNIVKVLSPGSPVVVVNSGDFAPDTAGATFASFSNAVINDSDHIAFAATLKTGVGDATSTNAGGIWADNSTGTRHLIARQGQVSPGVAGASFTAFSDPEYNDHDTVAFSATYTVGAATAANTGIWCNGTGTLALVAKQGGTVPGCFAGVTFASFTELALDNAGGAIFSATLTGPGVTTANNTGIFAVDATGTLQLIVRPGDVLNGKTITALAFLPSMSLVNGQTRSFSPSTGDLIYTATFADHSQSIFNVVFP